MQINWAQFPDVPSAQRSAAERLIERLVYEDDDLLCVRIAAEEIESQPGDRQVKLTCVARDRLIVASRHGEDPGVALEDVLVDFERQIRKLRRSRGAAASGCRTARGISALLVACAALGASAALAATPEPTRQTMHRVFRALSTLLPVALSSSGWKEAAKRADVQRSLGELAEAADQLHEHGGPEALSFAFLSQSLEDDARAIRARVAEGRYDSASYLTQRMTETCVACHARLPAKSVPGFAERLLGRVDRTALSAFARAHLQIATRQFDAGLTTYETAFADPHAPIALLAYDLPSYLVVSLRVLGDPERAKHGLAALAGRPDLSAQLEQNLGIWRSALSELAPALAEEPSLDRARAILSEGRELCDFPSDRTDLVHAVIASRLIYSYLEQSKPQGQERAEALYLLGQSEAFTRRSFELSEAEYYLEQAIRSAPHTSLAERAYAKLEQETVLGYTGSSGEHVPGDVRKRLAELRKLSRTQEDEHMRPHLFQPGSVRLESDPPARRPTVPESGR